MEVNDANDDEDGAKNGGNDKQTTKTAATITNANENENQRLSITINYPTIMRTDPTAPEIPSLLSASRPYVRIQTREMLLGMLSAEYAEH